MLDLDSLNVNQRRAVAWNDGPMLVLAGPGAGKTRVLATRVARLIQDTPDKRFRVLALTFTTKAADEMRSRVEQLLGPDVRRARLTTFHGFATDVLRQHGSHIGLRPDFTILNQEADRHLVLRDAVADAGDTGMPARATARGVLPLVDRLLREGHDGREDPRVPLPFAAPDKEWIRPIYKAYIRLLIEGNHLDFGALLICCLRLFKERPRIARDYGVVYPFACVDEYQDTNKIQDILLHALYPERNANLFVVADDDQTIYQWNGASPERIRRLQDDYDMQVVQLPESFRCPPEVVDLANNLIRHNVNREPNKKPLVSAVDSSPSGAVRVQRFTDCATELSWIAEDIKRINLDPGRCTVLARSTKLVRAAAAALSRAGVPAYIVKRKAEFESSLLRFLHSALRLANRPADLEQLAALCHAYCHLTGVRVQTDDAEAESAIEGESLLAGFMTVVSSHVGATAQPLLETLRSDLVNQGKYRDFIANTFSWRDRASQRNNTDRDEETEERNIWNSLTTEIRQHLGADPTLSQFLQQLDLRQKTSPPRATDVQCLTIHLAKGKEFQHVYLAGLAEEHLPSYQAVQGGPSAMEEERRNCFVAITRVQSSLTLTHADSYFGWSKQPSRFLAEMGLHSRDTPTTSTLDATEQTETGDA